MDDFIDNAIVRCNGDHWVRRLATEQVETVENGETFTHYWCLSCLAEIDELTETAIRRPSEYPANLDQWDDDNPKQGE